MTAPTTPSTSWADIAARGVVQEFTVCEDEEHRTPYCEQPEHTGTASEEQGALFPSEGRYDPFDDHVQVDVTMKAAQHTNEAPSLLARLVLATASNAMVHMTNGGAAMDERRDLATPQVQAKQQESREISQTDLEEQESGSVERELGALMEGRPHAISNAQ